MRSFIWTNGPMILYVTYNMCWETISLNFVSEVTLFAKITKGVKGFPKIHYRLQKHQRHIQQSMGLVSEWQCSGRGTPCVLQTAPRLTGVQLRSSAQMLKDFRGHLEESFLFRIIIEWIIQPLPLKQGLGKLSPTRGFCYATILVQDKPQVSFLDPAFFFMFLAAASLTPISVFQTEELSLYVLQCLDILFGLPIAVLLPLPVSTFSATNVLIYSFYSVFMLFVKDKSFCCCVLLNSKKRGRRSAWDTLQEVEFKNIFIQNHSCTKGHLLTRQPSKELIRRGDSSSVRGWEPPEGLEHVWCRRRRVKAEDGYWHMSVRKSGLAFCRA